VCEDSAHNWYLTSPFDGVDKGARDAFPLWLAKKLLARYQADGLPVLDVFLGSGTTMIAADQLDLPCYGIEIDTPRALAAKGVVRHPERVFEADAAGFDSAQLGPIGLILTSPPFSGFGETATGEALLSPARIGEILVRYAPCLEAGGTLLLEMIDVPTAAGHSSSADCAAQLATAFAFVGSIALCDTGRTPIAGKTFHTSVQVWRRRASVGTAP